MARQDIERQKLLEPLRIDFAVKKIIALGFTISHYDSTKVKFTYNGQEVTFFPYSGWHSGKSIVAGRGLRNLLKQIK